jgi:hypothetical protein
MQFPFISFTRSSHLLNKQLRHFIASRALLLIALLSMAFVAAAVCGEITSAATSSFALNQDFATGSRPRSVSVGDLNGDGKLDLATANVSSNNVSVLLNTSTPNGAASFATKHDFATGIAPISLTVSDMNRDGKPDLVVANVNSNTLAVLLNTTEPGAAAPSFSDKQDLATADGPLFVTASDLNGDGNLDLVVANLASSVSVFLNNSAPGATTLDFAVRQDFVTGDGPRSVAAGDFNGDGKLDIAVVNFDSNSVAVLLNGTVPGAAVVRFDDVHEFPTGVRPTSVAVGDVDRDGKLDLAVANLVSNTVSVLLNTTAPGATTSSFSGKQDFATNFIPTSITVGELNGDGMLDLAVANSNSDNVSVLLNTAVPGSGAPSFAIKQDFDTGNRPVSVIKGDLNGDGKLDLAVANLDADSVSVLLNTPAPEPKTLQFSATIFPVEESGSHVDITVTRSGDISGAASVNFSTLDDAGLQPCSITNGTSSPRCDFIYTLGTLTWAAGDASAKILSVAIVDDSYAEGAETFRVALSNPVGAVLGGPSTATVNINDNETVNGPNPIDQTDFFVRQQYIDFLGREPDPAGFAGWTSTINNCAAGDTSCDRIHVSQLFYQSDEFQARGYYVFKFYLVSLPGIVGVDPSGAGHKPDYAQFAPDAATVSGFLTEAQLNVAKDQFAVDFVARPLFVARYGGLNPTQYVDSLLSTAGVTTTFPVSVRQSLIDGLTTGTLTRARVLRQIVDSPAVSSKYFNEGYVAMEYFGYLRRDPDELYLDWLDVINQTNDARGMVTGFVNSIEYRQRFGPP